MDRSPRPGDIFYLTKDRPYQIITMGVHKETGETMVVYQALYGDFITFVLPLTSFIKEIDIGDKKAHIITKAKDEAIVSCNQVNEGVDTQDKVSHILLRFLDANSYSEKLELITTNINELNDRLINDMAISIDCAVDEGPIEQRIQDLIFCLKQISRFEDRRLR